MPGVRDKVSKWWIKHKLMLCLLTENPYMFSALSFVTAALTQAMSEACEFKIMKTLYIYKQANYAEV